MVRQLGIAEGVEMGLTPLTVPGLINGSTLPVTTVFATIFHDALTAEGVKESKAKRNARLEMIVEAMRAANCQTWARVEVLGAVGLPWRRGLIPRKFT